MAISLDDLVGGSTLKPPIVLLYSPEGKGKTTLGVNSPNPIFMQFEDGLGNLSVTRFPKIIETWDEVVDGIKMLATTEHGLETMVYDTLDHLEPIIRAEACARNQWESIETPGFGKGYVAELEVWREFMSLVKALRDDKNMTQLLLAHAYVHHNTPPDTEPYDQYTPKLHCSKSGAGANTLVRELADAVLFMNTRTTIVRDQGKNDKKGEGNTRGVGGDARFIQTTGTPSAIAKRRAGVFLKNTPSIINLPMDPDLSWKTLAPHMTYFATQPAPTAPVETI